MILRTILVEDEALALKRLKRLLGEHKERINIIGEAVDGQQAVELIDDLKPDLVFLDIQMPELNGFEVLEKIDHSPEIIFTTAYDEYAIKAFEVNSVDYLLKPIEPVRLAKAINRLSGTENKFYAEKISGLIQMYEQNWTTKLQAKIGDKIKFIDVDSIAYLKSADKYVQLNTVDKKNYLLNESLSDLEKKLNPKYFKRIHRSCIVNTDLIDEIVKGKDGKPKIKLKKFPDVRIPIGESFKENLSF